MSFYRYGDAIAEANAICKGYESLYMEIKFLATLISDKFRFTIEIVYENRIYFIHHNLRSPL